MNDVMSYYSQFMELSKANPIVASVLATGLAGSLMFYVKALPRRLWDRLTGLVIHTVTFDRDGANTYDYDLLMEFIVKHGSLFTRTVSGVFKREGKDVFYFEHTQGYGKSHWWYKGRLYSVVNVELESTGVDMQKRRLKLSALGLTNKSLVKVLDEVASYRSDDRSDVINAVDYHGSHQWRHYDISPRHPETVILNEGVWEKITGTIDRYLASRAWYLEKGIPYKLNIMLAGPPGTGKTSIIMALATKYRCYLLDHSTHHNLDQGRDLFVSPKGELLSISIMEDIERNHKFSGEHSMFRGGGGVTSNDDDVVKEGTPVGDISKLLNILSGLKTPDGMVTISTSNDLSKLPEQLLRPSRMDLIIEIGHLNRDAVNRYFKLMYGVDYDIPMDIPEHRASYLQTLYTSNVNDPDAFIEAIKAPEVKVERKSYVS